MSEKQAGPAEKRGPASEEVQALLRAHIAQSDPHTVHAALGIRFESFDPDALTVAVDVSEKLFQHGGIVHGGVYVLLAESAASTAAAFYVDITQNDVSGLAINASHLRKVTEGKLTATATPLHRGRTTHVYNVDVRDAQARLVSTCRCTLAIRPRQQT